jgi:hypothetical protein
VLENSNIKYVSGNLVDAINNFKDYFFDFIYIDAAHDRRSVLRDIGLSISKLKNNGVICGHDYQHCVGNGVKHAVDTVFYNQEISFFSDTSWAVRLNKNKIFNESPIYLLIFNSTNLKDNTINIKKHLSCYFDKIFTYDEESIKKLPKSSTVCNVFKDKLNNHNIEANNLGYFDFKPFLMQHVMRNEIPENSILLYHDGNFKKYPVYWHTQWSHIKELLQILLANNFSDVFVSFQDNNIAIKSSVKNYTINKLFDNEDDRDIVRNSRLFRANRVAVKNTEFARQFIDEWHNLCQDKSLIAPYPNPDPPKEFLWNCGDQDVLNCLIYKYILNKLLPPTFSMYYFLDNLFTFSNICRWQNQLISQNLITSNKDKMFNFYRSLP